MKLTQENSQHVQNFTFCPESQTFQSRERAVIAADSYFTDGTHESAHEQQHSSPRPCPPRLARALRPEPPVIAPVPASAHAHGARSPLPSRVRGRPPSPRGPGVANHAAGRLAKAPSVLLATSSAPHTFACASPTPSPHTRRRNKADPRDGRAARCGRSSRPWGRPKVSGRG